MSVESATIVDRQVRRARRRLFVRALSDALLFAWAAGFALVGLWFLLQPLAWADADAGIRWRTVGGLLALSTAFGFTLAFWARPSSVQAALELDARFGLKERVTTSLTLSADQSETRAGRALRADAIARVARLRVGDKFPLRPAWSKALLPVAGAAIATAFFFLGPTLRSLVPDAPELKKLVQSPEVQQPLEDLKKAVFRPRDDQASKEQKELDEALQKLLHKPLPENQEQVRERVQEMKRLEEKMQDRINSLQEQANKGDRLKNQLQKLGQSAEAKKTKAKEGPAKELEDALTKGDMDKALEALEKLTKKLKNDQLDAKELQQLAQQFNDLHEKLQRLMNMRDLHEKLQREVDLGNMTPEQMKDLLAREMEDMQDLQELADLLKELKDRLPKDGAGALARLKGKLQKLKLTEEELDELERNGECLCAAREALLLALQQMAGAGLGNQFQQTPGFGKRPFGKEPNSKVKKERQRSPIDPTGEHTVTWSGPTAFKKVPAQEVGGVVRQSAQDAYQALDRQRIPPEYADSARGYFQNLSRPKEEK